MNIEYKNFIGRYHNVYPEGFCEHIINEFEFYQNTGAVRNRQITDGAAKTIKDDLNIFFSFRGHHVENFNGENTIKILQNGIQKCLEEYGSEYPVLQNDAIAGSAFKVQKTVPGAGYHVWHNEQGSNFDASTRVLVYILYLNTLDVDQAGETEFLYQQERIRPIENTLVIWPASFTHTHRGNTVFGEKSKYIVTGWFNYN